ncbi:MAG: ATP-dependent zinc protease [Phycisphaera sp.]|nr:ATP-dependent zinc protease [Phycisphaera sp.]
MGGESEVALLAKVKAKPSKPMIGWREWITLPDLGVSWVKAKIDTGARSSALHAHDVEVFKRDGREWVRFKVHPMQRSTATTVACEAEMIDQRWVRSSGGHETLRPVIVTPIVLMGERHEIELTLTNRDAMGFRMLLGRQALRGSYAIDPGRSYLGGRGPKRKKKKIRKAKRVKKTATPGEETERRTKRVASSKKDNA